MHSVTTFVTSPGPASTSCSCDQTSRRDAFDTSTVDEDDYRSYPWMAEHDQRFTLALVLDVVEVVVRHGYEAPTGVTLVDLTAGLFRALQSGSPGRL